MNFFDIWIYNEGFPSLVTRWNRKNATQIELQLNQNNIKNYGNFFCVVSFL